jgi:RIO kinase 1
MKVPKRLKPLVDDGLVDEILSQLMSGKEAQVYVVRCGAAIRCAKVYKEANQRSFKQAVQYQEGRKVRNSRQARAMGKRTRYGQKESEQAWVSATGKKSRNRPGSARRWMHSIVWPLPACACQGPMALLMVYC